MSKIRGAGAVAILTTALLTAASGAYAADAPQPSAAYPGGVVVARDGGNTATVRVAYTCTADVSPANHLFVAVKQGPNVSPTSASSDETTTAFLSTNWNSDVAPNALTCDGRRHVQNIVLQPQPGTDYGPLTSGPALVQICVYDNVTGFDGFEPIGGFASSYTMERVVVTGAH